MHSKVKETMPVRVQIVEDLLQKKDTDIHNFSKTNAVKSQVVVGDRASKYSKNKKHKRLYLHDQLMNAVIDISNGISVWKASMNGQSHK